jgi:hypothetical protein
MWRKPVVCLCNNEKIEWATSGAQVIDLINTVQIRERTSSFCSILPTANNRNLCLHRLPLKGLILVQSQQSSA